MEFIKKNYEKIILSLVLLGLVGVLAFMPVVIFYDQTADGGLAGPNTFRENPSRCRRWICRGRTRCWTG